MTTEKKLKAKSLKDAKRRALAKALRPERPAKTLLRHDPADPGHKYDLWQALQLWLEDQGLNYYVEGDLDIVYVQDPLNKDVVWDFTLPTPHSKTEIFQDEQEIFDSSRLRDRSDTTTS